LKSLNNLYIFIFHFIFFLPIIVSCFKNCKKILSDTGVRFNIYYNGKQQLLWWNKINNLYSLLFLKPKNNFFENITTSFTHIHIIKENRKLYTILTKANAIVMLIWMFINIMKILRIHLGFLHFRYNNFRPQVQRIQRPSSHHIWNHWDLK